MTGPAESRDPVTGADLTRLTGAQAYQHHLHAAGPTLTPDGGWLVFVSWETGSPNLCARQIGGADTRRLTYRPDLRPLSPAITRDGLAVIYAAGDSLQAATLADGEETELAAFAGGTPGDPGLTPDGRAAIVPVSTGTRQRLVEVDLYTRAVRVLHEEESRAAPARALCSPDGSRILLEGGPGEMPRLLPRDGSASPADLLPETEGEWIAHPAWVGTGALTVVKFHDGLYVVEPGGSARCVFKGPIWHAASDATGALLACDTHVPDIGLLLVSPATGKWKVLCHPRAGNKGARWFEPLPADAPPDPSLHPRPGAKPDDRESAWGPVWTHPRPSFAPDGKSVLFTTDASGWPQVMSARIPDGWRDDLTR